ncbi:MAG: peptide deformylase [Alphaproteobacteria bacterium]|nr:peptide deformylase [Alphaproteobacteria bacterium]
MAVLEVRTVPDPVLRQEAAPVEKPDAQLRQLLDDMVETMYALDGVGLAGNQVGVLKRVLVVDISKTRDGSEALKLINPVILEESEEGFVYREGCLSVRPEASDSETDLFADVTRPKTIKIQYMDVEGVMQEIEADSLLSQCIQHEMDHLDGVLFIDHLSSLKRGIILRRIDKVRRQKQVEQS